MMEKWVLAMKKADFDAWSKRYGISPITARLLRNRDLEEKNIEKFLHGTLSDCYSPFLLKGMDRAVELLHEKIEEKKTIRIIGDYDADGICAASILKAGLSKLGACVDVVIPHRVKDGYGLNEGLIEEAFRDGVDTILTCDNGISAARQIERAKELGMTVLVTDHHEVPYEMEGETRVEVLPCADAVIDPKQETCQYPYKNICGALVAYKLVQALYYPAEQQELFDELLQYAAIATVCDVMELLDENRIIVKEGIRRMQKKPALGLEALMQVNQIEKEKVSAYHLGFVLGPCLNATGRLDTAGRAIELLEAEDRIRAMQAARELKELNENRKLLTQKGVESAENQIIQGGIQQEKVWVLYLSDCHESIAGIIAGRIREKYARPVFILTDSLEEVKGSGRSIEGYDMYQAIHECRECLIKYGGHKMAAGFSLKKQDVDAFRKKINANCSLSLEDMAETVHIDIALPLSHADEKLAKELTVLEPFGTGNRRPLFARKNLLLSGLSRMGGKGEYVRLSVQEEDGVKREMTYFGNGEELLAYLKEKEGEEAVNRLLEGRGSCYLTCAYQIGMRSFRGIEQVSLTLKHYY